MAKASMEEALPARTEWEAFLLEEAFRVEAPVMLEGASRAEAPVMLEEAFRVEALVMLEEAFRVEAPVMLEEAFRVEAAFMVAGAVTLEEALPVEADFMVAEAAMLEEAEAAVTAEIQDMNGVRHTVDVAAGSLYEAVALGMAAIRTDEWVPASLKG